MIAISSTPLDELTGVRLQIFCYLLQIAEPVGVRDTQRALGLKTPSHASYHLQRMYERGLLEKTAQNAYFIKDEYRVKSIHVNVLTEYYLLMGRFWPRTVFFATYLVLSLIFAFVLLARGLSDVLNYYLILSLVMSVIVAITEIKRQLNALPGDES